MNSPLLSTSAIILCPVLYWVLHNNEVPKTTALLVWKVTEQTPLASRAAPSHIISYHSQDTMWPPIMLWSKHQYNPLSTSYINQKWRTLAQCTLAIKPKNQSTHLSHHWVYSRHADSLNCLTYLSGGFPSDMDVLRSVCLSPSSIVSLSFELL